MLLSSLTVTRPQFIFDFPLHTDRQNQRERPLLAFGAPRATLIARQPEEVPEVLRNAEMHARAGAWVAGFVSYEAAPGVDPALRVRSAADPAAHLPLAWFGIFDAPLPDFKLPAPVAPEATLAWQPSLTNEQFAADLALLREAIHDGVAYQINHTLRMQAADLPVVNDLPWFAYLRNAQPNGYCAYLNLGQQRILSASPELFFRRDGGLITTRPMKGTAARGRWAAEDKQQAEWLRTSAKNQAENLMIVDLLRNDLSRIALPHSVSVPTLFSVERYPTVWQMTSTITAQTRPQTGLDELFAALFPCGSITGAPKAKAMQLIAERETTPRGIYCGAIGLLQPGGDAVFNVAIRTLQLDAQRTLCGVGSGITWDSTASAEYAETLVKTRFLAGAPAGFGLFETLRLEQGEYFLLERHLARLSDSAQYLGFPFNAGSCRARLTQLAARHPTDCWRVRLSLDAAGAIDCNATLFPVQASQRASFALAATPIPRNALWLYHKTTQRTAYDQALAARPSVFDVLLWNEDGELTEFTRGNLIIELDGRRYTPPQHCGLLDGTLRREMLEQGSLHERVLTRADLARASRICFINSLRGEIEVVQAKPD